MMTELEMIQKAIERSEYMSKAKTSRLEVLRLVHRIPDCIFTEILEHARDLYYWNENTDFWRKMETEAMAVYPPPTGD